jgi:hypothetical protein
LISERACLIFVGTFRRVADGSQTEKQWLSKKWLPLFFPQPEFKVMRYVKAEPARRNLHISSEL